jgi:chemotaxis protein MotA
MLKKLDDPATLGPSMAVALVTTFYGVVLANLVFNPMVKKLKDQTEMEVLQKELQIEGILSILNGEDSRIIREKLTSFYTQKKKKEPKKADAKGNVEAEEE